ncbi:MAG: mevalonate kinase [Candidatus Micrarchaeia archaeon]
MENVEAPAVIKLLGEHAVVYGRLSVAAAISLYAEASMEKSGSEYLKIRLEDLGLEGTFNNEQLKKLGADYEGRKSIEGYIEERNIDRRILPFATIAARISKELDMDMSGISITIRSRIPMGKGLASSAAASTAFAVCLIKEYSERTKKVVDSEIAIDIARDGERIVHVNENAGKIDVSTSYLGGIVSYSASAGAKKESATADFKLVLIDTGPKKSTAETVGHVTELYNRNREYVESIMDKIDKCSNIGLHAIKMGDTKLLGRYMFIDHHLLRQLGVSSERLDMAVEAAEMSGAYGAKLSGGGGGGIAIAITDKESQLIESLAKLNMEARAVAITDKGASAVLKATKLQNA